MRETSIFVDESGELGTESRRYLVCLVFHDQAYSIDEQIRRYNNALVQSELIRIKFAAHEETASDKRFFATESNLNRSYIKKFKRNRME